MQAPSTMRVTVSPSRSTLVTPLRPRLLNCQSAAVRVVAAASTRATSSAPVKWAPYEQQPWTISGAGPVSTPRQPLPKMQVHGLARKVRSKTQVRSSSMSSKLNHSWADSGDGGRFLPFSLAASSATDDRLATEVAELVQQLTGGQQAFPELAHHHPLVGGVVAVVGQRDAEVQHRGGQHPAQRLLRAAAAFPGEQRRHAPH